MHIPLYADIRDDLLQNAREIFGNDIYLEPDAQDYQLIAQFSDKLSDALQLMQKIYNNRSPGSAVGGGLDGVVKINGIRRKGQGHSQVDVTISGIPGTRILGGIVRDNDRNLWDVANVTIPDDGTVESLATCRTPGAIFADVGTITRIVTQLDGWHSVVNNVNAMVGRAIEEDPDLRSRQAISTARPSKTVLLGTIGGIAEMQNVLRSVVYENDTNVFGFYGIPIPGHSICAVVEGGDEKEIAEEMRLRKTPGCLTVGDIEIPIESPDPALGIPPPIRFYRPQYVDVCVQITIAPLAGYVSEMEDRIGQNVTEYLNKLNIGGKLSVSALYVPAQTATPDITAPLFSIHELVIGTDFGNLSRDDMEIAFNEVTRGIRDNVRVIVL